MGSDLPPPPPSPTQQTPRRQVLGGRGIFACSSSTWLGTAIVPQVACLTAFVVGSRGRWRPKDSSPHCSKFLARSFFCFQNSILVGRRERGGIIIWKTWQIVSHEILLKGFNVRGPAGAAGCWGHRNSKHFEPRKLGTAAKLPKGCHPQIVLHTAV